MKSGQPKVMLDQPPTPQPVAETLESCMSKLQAQMAAGQLKSDLLQHEVSSLRATVAALQEDRKQDALTMQLLRSELDALKCSQHFATPLYGTCDSAPVESTESAPAGFTFGVGDVTSDGMGKPPFRPTQKHEQMPDAPGQIGTVNYMSVTMMPEYQHKSFDELRFEHYHQGRRPTPAPMPPPPMPPPTPGKFEACTPEGALEGDDPAKATPPPRVGPPRPPSRRFQRPAKPAASPDSVDASSPDSIIAGMQTLSMGAALPPIGGESTWSAAQLDASRAGWQISADQAAALDFLVPAICIQSSVRRRAAQKGLPPSPSRTAAPSPCIGNEANQQAAEEWLSKAKARYEAGDDGAAARFCEKSLRLLESAAARDFAEHLREFGDGSVASEAAARALAAADHRSVLEVGRGATVEEVKKAYRRLALRLHPDRNRARQAEAAFKRLLEAYNSLTAAGRRSPSPASASDDGGCDGGSDAGLSYCPHCDQPMDPAEEDEFGMCYDCYDEQEGRHQRNAHSKKKAHGTRGGGRCYECGCPYTPPPSYHGNRPMCFDCRNTFDDDDFRYYGSGHYYSD